jgi:hypothetical protein
MRPTLNNLLAPGSVTWVTKGPDPTFDTSPLVRNATKGWNFFSPQGYKWVLLDRLEHFHGIRCKFCVQSLFFANEISLKRGFNVISSGTGIF